jgi:predicted acylesterase/phospholipase RssA
MNHNDRNKKGGAHRSRALVLGAGGPVGRAWQSGLIAGLIEREIDLGDASLIIGTSAGAIVGAQLALGLKFAAPSKLDLAVQAAPASSSSDMSELLAAIARASGRPNPKSSGRRSAHSRSRRKRPAKRIPSPGPPSPRSGDTPGPYDSARLR